MSDVLQEFSRKATLTYARARVPRNYVGLTLFPANETNELSFEYFQDANRLPIMASIQAFGAEAQIASRDGTQKVTGDIPTIKRKIPLRGRELIALRREGAGDADIVRNGIYNDIDNMIDAVHARIEQMRMDAVALGSLTLNENGVIMTVNYGVPANHQTVLAGNALWSDPVNSRPISDMLNWQNILVGDGAQTPGRSLTSNTVVANLLRAAEVRQLIYGDQGGSRAVSLQQLNELMRTMGLPPIATYDLQVRRENPDGTFTSARLFPANRFVMLPADPLGETLLGPTEESLLDPEVDTAEVAGVYAAVYQETEPPAVWTKAAASSIPTFPYADSVFQAVVI